jgi:hypothetical protein
VPPANVDDDIQSAADKSGCFLIESVRVAKDHQYQVNGGHGMNE